MKRHQWDKLNNQQTGAYAEYFVKMEFTMFGFQVYSSEVDDRGIDFVCRHESGPFIEVQVKSIRGLNYVFMRKCHFQLRKTLYLSLVIFPQDKEPSFYLIPSLVWEKPNALFVSRDYVGKKSKPEWGLNISQKNLQELRKYEFDKSIEGLMNLA